MNARLGLLKREEDLSLTASQGWVASGAAVIHGTQEMMIYHGRITGITTEEAGVMIGIVMVLITAGNKTNAVNSGSHGATIIATRPRHPHHLRKRE